MRIAQVTPVFPPYRGGIGTVAEDYTEAMRRRGAEVTVFTPSYGRGLGGERADQVQRMTGVIQFGNAALVPTLFWRLRDYDVIHLHYPFYGGALFAMLAAKLWRKRFVLTYHMKTKGSGLLWFMFWLHRLLLEPIILWAADVVLVSSFDYAESVGLRHARLAELPFGVDTQVFCPGKCMYARDYLGIERETPLFLFVGGLDEAHYFKGVEVLLQACAKLPKDLDWHVLVAGGGNLLADYQAQAIRLGVAHRVHFPGRVSFEGLPKVYRDADVHLLPSIDRSEAFGVVTLEAGASGLPSIVSDLPGVRTLVAPEETGLIVPPEDVSALSCAMRRLLDSPSERQAWGQNARQRVSEHYDKDVLFDRLYKIYQTG